MLNMNVYSKRKEFYRFRFGFSLDLGGLALHRYLNGEFGGKIMFFQLGSPGTGHWPFNVFDLSFLTGSKRAWQVTVLGLTVGSKMMHDQDPDTRVIRGPDYRKRYWYFSCLNHQHKITEETI